MYSNIDLHDRNLFYLLIILFVVVWFLVSAVRTSSKYHLAYLHHGNTLELDWTTSPALVVWAIGIPTLELQISDSRTRFCPHLLCFELPERRQNCTDREFPMRPVQGWLTTHS